MTFGKDPPSQNNKEVKRKNMIKVSEQTIDCIVKDLVNEICRNSENENDGIYYWVLPHPIKMKYTRGHKTNYWNVLGITDTETEVICVGYLDSNDNPVFYPIEAFDKGVIGLFSALTE